MTNWFKFSAPSTFYPLAGKLVPVFWLLAAIFGAIPLVMATGAGVEIRRPLGITIVGGLVFSQILTLYTTPVVYLYMERLRVWLGRRRSRQLAHGNPSVSMHS